MVKIKSLFGGTVQQFIEDGDDIVDIPFTLRLFRCEAARLKKDKPVREKAKANCHF